MEGSIARWYAKNTAKSLGEFKNCAKQIGEHLARGSCVLEVASGPGYLAIELAKLGRYRIFALDISKTSVQLARQNARAAEVEIKFQRGDTARMPYESDTNDLMIC